MPTPLPQISSLAWEHPADRAALNTLRAIPGFDEIVRKAATYVSERRVRQIFLANAVQVGPMSLLPVGLALLPFHLALLEWHRKSELSSDRAALLALQDRVVAGQTFMRLAGGRDFGDTSSAEAFMIQASTYETGGDAWDN